MIKLVLPNIKYKKSYLSALKEYSAENLLDDKIDHAEVARDFTAYLKKIDGKRRGKYLPPGYSPQTEYWLVSQEDGYIGTVIIRHTLNDTLLRVGGNIGYYIRPTCRGRGFGKQILTLALPRAKKIGLRKVLITCDETNLGSRKIIEANGGVFENRVPNGEGHPLRMRFWVDLTQLP